jgi:histidinol dehydrogenase
MTVRRYDLSTLSPADRDLLVRRSAVPDPGVRSGAAAIVDSVRTGGDAALRAANDAYGGGRPGPLRVARAEMEEALATLPADLVEALRAAAANIRRYHEAQVPTDLPVSVVPGVRVVRRWSPLRRVGVYVPGGRAAYPSSLLMGVIPAVVAGVGSIVVATPADDEGNLSPVMLGAAALTGVTEMIVTGGAQAVGALAYGTETVTRVDKIVGPGNAWVTAAKLAVFGDCAVDLPAGPSEALIVADGTADPRIVAADLLCQAEHGPDSPVGLVTTDPDLLDAVAAEVERMLPDLEREPILRKALEDHGMLVLAPDHDAALAFADDFAPEHIGIHTADPQADASRVPSAGSVYLGHWTPESAGDYATGANHILPTGGLARSYGPLSVLDFGSWRQEQEATREGLERLRPIIAAIATAEGLTAHRACVDVRFEQRVRFEERS